MKVRWNLAVLDCQRRLEHTGNSRGAFSMSDDCLDATNQELAILPVGEENALDGPGLDS